MSGPNAKFSPSAEQMALWPRVSGNAINGRGETAPRRPTPIYWHAPDATPHGPLQRWFQSHNLGGELLAQARAERQRILDTPLAPLSETRAERSPREWSDEIRVRALAAGADIVGITRMRPQWVFEGHEVRERWIVMLGVAHDYEQMKTAPLEPSFAEVIRQYGRGNKAARELASWLRSQGHDARPHGGPMAGPATLIPAAIECGFGELGKHGSLINRTLGASFRLASVLCDVELVANEPDVFGADAFCTSCRVCENACPPRAIAPEKQLVRGEVRWYVDFDQCLPYFNENGGCGICIAVCPWSLPGVAERLVVKMARRAR
ncbi:MAG: 4Fe-4S dicluster domain-containing protein [Burkholderiaceae bacterium]|nr:4Fe-4S dicluster domain-containing protein [Burkholderiaceae bacterium]